MSTTPEQQPNDRGAIFDLDRTLDRRAVGDGVRRQPRRRRASPSAGSPAPTPWPRRYQAIGETMLTAAAGAPGGAGDVGLVGRPRPRRPPRPPPTS